jgi:hypothetical protein
MNTYYQNCPFPKPISKKRKKKVNGYKDKPDRVCFYCKTPYAERHEVFGGANRQISIDNGFQVDLCMNCHREIQDNITEWAQKQNRIWRKFFQTKYEIELMREGLSPERAREAWISLIGRNYL